MSQHPPPDHVVEQIGLSVVRAQPDYLETVARLRGMQPAPAAQARVLELGCGAGQNLLPLADRYPDARFVGVDQAGRGLDVARTAIREISLANVELREHSLLEPADDLGTFDYIIANGVYSWVDAAARDMLLAICRDHLAEQGVAFVSYKTYPGWAVHDMFRNMMLYDTQGAATGQEKMARARMLFEFLGASLIETESYGALLRGELATLHKQSDSHLLDDHLADVSHPVYFADFAAHAESFGLQTAGDGVLGIRRWDYLGEELERGLDEITSNDVERELYRDVLHGRTVRQTLLCHRGVGLNDAVAPENLAGLYLEGALQCTGGDGDVSSQAMAQFTNRAGVRISTRLPLVKSALAHLSEAWPDYVPFEECVSVACSRIESTAAGEPLPAEEIERLKSNLSQCCTGAVLDLHAARPEYLPQVSDKPAASPLVRWQARRSEVVTNRRHEPVRLQSFERSLVDLLDGTRTQAELIDVLATAAGQGRLTVTQNQQRVVGYDDAKRALALAVPESLTGLARWALLIA